MMIKNDIPALAGKRILFLQGPVGPFFRRFSEDLTAVGATVYKINFNGGDWLFYPTHSIAFRGNEKAWPEFFERHMLEWKIDLVMFFGDCRRLHQIAHEIAQLHRIEVGVFEEGYLRPNHITLERFGVNGYSQMPNNADYFCDLQPELATPAHPVGKTFNHAAVWAIIYYVASSLLRPWFRHYQHHRPLTIWEGLYWFRAWWRKHLYAYRERGIQQRLTSQFSKRYFLVPLQMHNDTQICVHSTFASIDDFISHVMHSFAYHAPADAMLVLKQHPMDRGYHDYSSLVRQLSGKYQLGSRILYVHDLHLPSLLEHARGVVVINSTVGLSALHHYTPLKTCGNAIYDLVGLTYQGTLDQFWNAATDFKVDRQLLQRFQHYLTNVNQINGSFYKRLPNVNSKTGLRWPEPLSPPLT